MERPLYLDHNATTPIHPAVAAAMRPWLEEGFGNPSSDHVYGQAARAAVEAARSALAALLQCTADEVIFTGGGTESNNLALRGVAAALAARGRHLVTTTVEHPAVSEVMAHLETRGFTVTRVAVDGHGRVDPDAVAAALRPETILVSVMHAQNEVGTVMPLSDIAALCRARGVLLHTDAAQSVGKIPTSVDALGVDLLTVAGHKLYAPKGVGALYVRRGTPLARVVFGAGHEGGRRPGTENVLGLVGLGRAAQLAAEDLAAQGETQRALRDRLEAALVAGFAPGAVRLHGHPTHRLPNTLNLGFRGLQAPALLAALPGVAASAGAACHAGEADPSTVLGAMGVPPEYAAGAVRFSLGRGQGADDMDEAARQVVAAARALGLR